MQNEGNISKQTAGNLLTRDFVLGFLAYFACLFRPYPHSFDLFCKIRLQREGDRGARRARGIMFFY